MRQDQIDRLNAIAEEIAEVFIDEATPNNWSGAGVSLVEMDADTRGNRYWDKKNAIQTGALLHRVMDLAVHDNNSSAARKMPEEDAERQIKQYEGKAKELIKAMQDATKSK